MPLFGGHALAACCQHATPCRTLASTHNCAASTMSVLHCVVTEGTQTRQ